MINRPLINPFSNKPLLLSGWSRSLLKTPWEKEKLLLKSNFSFSRCVSYLSGEPSAIFIKFEIVFCKVFGFESLKFVVFKRVNFLPDDKSLDWSKLKGLADNRLNVVRFLQKRKFCEKTKKNRDHRHFLFFFFTKGLQKVNLRVCKIWGCFVMGKILVNSLPDDKKVSTVPN